MQTPEQIEYYAETLSPEPATAAPVDPGPGPNNPPWGGWAALGVWVMSILFIIVLPTLFLLPYLLRRSPPILGSDALVAFAKTDPIAVILQISAVIPAHILTLLIAWLVVTRVRKYGFRQMLGWHSGGVQWWHYLIILISFMGIASLVMWYSPEQNNDMTQMLQSSKYVVYIVAVLATFTAPIVEEVVYRGVLYSAFQRSFGVKAAFVIVTLLFAAVHVPQYWPSYSTIFLLGLLSIALTAMRAYSRNLLPCIIFHTIFNGLQSILLVAGTLSGDPTSGGTSTIMYLLNHLK